MRRNQHRDVGYNLHLGYFLPGRRLRYDLLTCSQFLSSASKGFGNITYNSLSASSRLAAVVASHGEPRFPPPCLQVTFPYVRTLRNFLTSCACRRRERDPLESAATSRTRCAGDVGGEASTSRRADAQRAPTQQLAFALVSGNDCA